MVVDLAQLHLPVVAGHNEEGCKDDVEQPVGDEGLDVDRAVGDVEVVLHDEAEEHGACRCGENSEGDSPGGEDRHHVQGQGELLGSHECIVFALRGLELPGVERSGCD